MRLSGLPASSSKSMACSTKHCQCQLAVCSQQMAAARCYLLTDSNRGGMNSGKASAGRLSSSPDMQQSAKNLQTLLTMAPVLAMLVSYLLTTSMLYTMPMSAARAASSCSRCQQELFQGLLRLRCVVRGYTHCCILLGRPSR